MWEGKAGWLFLSFLSPRNYCMASISSVRYLGSDHCVKGRWGPPLASSASCISRVSIVQAWTEIPCWTRSYWQQHRMGLQTAEYLDLWQLPVTVPGSVKVTSRGWQWRWRQWCWWWRWHRQDPTFPVTSLKWFPNTSSTFYQNPMQ